jgi:glucose-1-phosphate cytidylyltransferase
VKVVLFCGGLGMRIRDYSENVPKPMVPVGYRPILWHVMKYYASFGHKDFVLCLGHRGDLIKNYFCNYDETISNDFVLSEGGRKVELLRSDISDWRITFCETGLNANLGERLMAVRRHLEGEPEFLANYSDGVTDLPLNDQLVHFREAGAIASFACVKPPLTYHFVSLGSNGAVERMTDAREAALRINGGFFIFRSDIFDYMRPGEELVVEPFRRLLEARRLVAYKYDGFWMPMDTFKDRQRLEELHSRGPAPWEVWATVPSTPSGG